MTDFSKQKVNVAVDNHSKLDVSSTHITSASFMQLQPVYYRHMLPGETIKGSANVLSRLASVAVPTYGRCRINMRAFFVPFRVIFPNFNEFITDTIASNLSVSSLVSSSPVLKNNDIVTYFTTWNGPDLQRLAVKQLSPFDPTTDPWDFETTAGDYYVLSYYGRHYLKILQSLGYRVIWNNKTASDNFDYSALPLLAYAKVFCDWYANQAYLDSAEYLALQQMFKFNTPNSNFTLDPQGLDNIFRFASIVCYDNGNDVFVNAWDNPVAPNANNFSSLGSVDITADTPIQTLVSQGTNGSPYMIQSANTNLSLGTQYIHDFLKSLTDYVKRNQLSGSAAIDRFLSRFGINMSSSAALRSVYISSQSIDVDFGSVMQTVNTAGAGQDSNLGDYAGQGLGRGEFSFEFKTDEFGLFLVTSSIVPSARLYQGLDRNNLHLVKSDFFTPEFDNLGCQEILKAEVYVSNYGTYGLPSVYKQGFGFAPRYYEYKQSHDFVTGDIVSPPAMRGGDAWHLNRQITDNTFGSLANQHHSLSFSRGDDSSQYDRIFNYSGLIDKFYLVYHFAAQSLAPCKSLFDSYDFDDAGHKLAMNGNSAKVN